MMFTAGDARNPLSSTSSIIEEILCNQLRLLLQRASQITINRRSKHLSIDDLIFIIRSKKALFNRIVDYLKWKNIRNPSDKNFKTVFSKLKNVNDNERLAAIASRTEKMTKEEYIDYSECRQASFTHKKIKKFREWVKPNKFVNVKVNDQTLEILGFIATDIVQSLVLSALKLVKTKPKEIESKCGLFSYSQSKQALKRDHVFEAFRQMQDFKVPLCTFKSGKLSIPPFLIK